MRRISTGTLRFQCALRLAGHAHEHARLRAARQRARCASSVRVAGRQAQARIESAAVELDAGERGIELAAQRRDSAARRTAGSDWTCRVRGRDCARGAVAASASTEQERVNGLTDMPCS